MFLPPERMNVAAAIAASSQDRFVHDLLFGLQTSPQDERTGAIVAAEDRARAAIFMLFAPAAQRVNSQVGIKADLQRYGRLEVASDVSIAGAKPPLGHNLHSPWSTDSCIRYPIDTAF